MLLSASRTFGAETAEGGIDALGVDLKTLVLQIVTFVLVFFLLKKFALDKVLKVLDERNKTIEDGVRLGQQMAEEKDKLSEKIEQMLKESRSEADKIIASGHKDAGDIVKAAEAAAEKKTQTLLTDAKIQINEEVIRARKVLEKEIISLVAEASEAVLSEKLDTPKDIELIKRQLAKVNK